MGHSGRLKLFLLISISIIAGIFLCLAGDGLRAYFTPDDAMNLYQAVFLPLAEAQRPVGTVVYRAIFALSGMDPLPYRAVCFLLLGANLVLLYHFARQLSGARETGLLACLLGAYHAHLADLYYSTGTLYDLLCFAFYFGALTYYVCHRRRGSLGWRQALVVLVLYLGALGAKEMAVTLPVFLALYEVLYAAPASGGRPLLRRLVPAGLYATLTAVYVASRFIGRQAAAHNPDYTPHFTWDALSATWRHYSGDLFYGAVDFTNTKLVVLWIVLLAVAAIARRREMWFAWAFLMLAPLPVSLITPRGFFAVYLSLPGWYLFTAAGLVTLRDACLRQTAAAEPGVPQFALFLLVAALLVPLHLHRKPIGSNWVAEAHRAVRSVQERLDGPGRLPRGARVLFLSDPYEVDDWILTFIFRLHYRDNEIRVDRAKSMREPPDMESYDRIYSLENWRLQLLRSR
jgi:hypothetical protein